MTTTIDSYIRSNIANKYYYEWYNNPKVNRLECFFPQFNNLHIFDEVHKDLLDTRDFFTQEQINSIGWEERFEIIRYLTEHITHPSNYDAACCVDYLLEEFKAWVYLRQWNIIFDKYALLQIAEHCYCEDNINGYDEFFEKITNDFSVRTAIAKIKRNKLFILGLSMKLSMRDCGLNII